jgi:hypothetical protein
MIVVYEALFSRSGTNVGSNAKTSFSGSVEEECEGVMGGMGGRNTLGDEKQ